MVYVNKFSAGLGEVNMIEVIFSAIIIATAIITVTIIITISCSKGTKNEKYKSFERTKEVSLKNKWVLLLMAFSVCIANEPQNTYGNSRTVARQGTAANKPQNAEIDSLIKITDDLTVKYNDIKNTIDSLSRKFISAGAVDAHKDISDDVIGFTQLAIMIITAFIGVAALFAVFVTFTNWRLGVNLKKGMKNQKTEFKNLKKDLEEERKKLKLDRDDMLREIGRAYLFMAMTHSNMAIKAFENVEKINENEVLSNIANHFSYLSVYYSLFCKYDIELNDDELSDFEIVDGFTSDYEKIHTSSVKIKDVTEAGFFDSFYEFKQYCEKTNKQEHLKKAENIWKELCRIFGGEQNMKEAMKEWNDKYQ